MNKNLIKILGLVATVVGFGATLLSGWVDEQSMEVMIDEKINEALAERENEEEEEL